MIKCRTAKRKVEGRQWSAQQLGQMKGSVQQPIPGTCFDKVRIGITDASGKIVKQTTHEPTTRKDQTLNRPSTSPTGAPSPKDIQKDVGKYDATRGCRACTDIIVGRDDSRQATTNRIAHNEECHTRMAELMRKDDVDKIRVEKADGRQAWRQEEVASAGRGQRNAETRRLTWNPGRFASSTASVGRQRAHRRRTCGSC